MLPSWFQSVKYYTGVISLGVLLGLGLQFAQAWSNPTQSAPNGNVAGPVNLGLLTQIKQGSLGLLGNLSAGLVQLNTIVTEGSPCASTGLVGRDTTGVVLSCQGGVWRMATMGGASGLVPSVENFLRAYAGRTLTFSGVIGTEHVSRNVIVTVEIQSDKARITSARFNGNNHPYGCQVTAIQVTCDSQASAPGRTVGIAITPMQISVHARFNMSSGGADIASGVLGILTTDMLNAGITSN